MRARRSRGGLEQRDLVAGLSETMGDRETEESRPTTHQRTQVSAAWHSAGLGLVRATAGAHVAFATSGKTPS
jgi:hypothetical protein